jgi:hypothetical protein
MGDIRSAWEIAQEKVEKLGEATEEERLRWKYVPEGEKLAAQYLGKDLNLLTELGSYQDNVRQYVVQGMEEILARNINLPKRDTERKNNRRAMDGLKILKNDKVAVENVFSRMRRIFDHYAEQGEQQQKQAYEALKAEMEARIQQAMQQQLGTFGGVKIDVERQPQFQEEWRKVQAQLDLQYIKVLDEYKQELAGIA